MKHLVGNIFLYTAMHKHRPDQCLLWHTMEDGSIAGTATWNVHWRCHTAQWFHMDFNRMWCMSISFLLATRANAVHHTRCRKRKPGYFLHTTSNLGSCLKRQDFFPTHLIPAQSIKINLCGIEKLHNKKLFVQRWIFFCSAHRVCVCTYVAASAECHGFAIEKW